MFLRWIEVENWLKMGYVKNFLIFKDFSFWGHKQFLLQEYWIT